MRTLVPLAVPLALAAGLLALPVGPAAAVTPPPAVEACLQLPPAERGACLDMLSTPTPEEVARQQAQARAMAQWHRTAATQLATGGQPRQLALAAWLLEISDWAPRVGPDGAPAAGEPATPGGAAAGEASAWRQAAAGQAGSDVIAWTLLQAAAPGNAAPGAVASAAAERWQALEPGNLAALMAADTPADALLVAARAARHYDSHFYPRVRWIAQQFRGLPTLPVLPEAPGNGAAARDPAADAVAQAIGIESALPAPGFKTLMDACDAQRGTLDATRHADCLHVAELLRSGDTVMAESVGIALQGRLARTAQERRAAAELERAFAWRQQEFVRLMYPDGAGVSPDFMRLFNDPTVAGERTLVERWLREAGVSLLPPPGWQPGAPGSGR